MNLYFVLSCIAMLEGNPSGHPADRGKARGELCIHQAVITDYNRAHGSRLTHAAVEDPEVAYEVGRWYLETHAAGRSVAQMGMIWNQGPRAARDNRGLEYGRRLENLVRAK